MSVSPVLRNGVPGLDVAPRDSQVLPRVTQRQFFLGGVRASQLRSIRSSSPRCSSASITAS